MKAPSPAFQLYPKDILSDEACAAMTDEELGIYLRLLCHAWLEGSIPADHGRLARMTRRRLPVFEALWLAIEPCWSLSLEEPDRLVQRRLEVERSKQIAFGDAQATRARDGAKKRASREKSAKEGSRGSAHAEPSASRNPAGSSLSVPSSHNGVTDNGNGLADSASPVCDVLASPPAKLKGNGRIGRETWLTGYGEDWQRRWGVASKPPFGEMAHEFRGAQAEHGEPKLRSAWQGFLASVDRAMYARPARFVQELGQWLGPRPAGVPARASPRASASEKTDAAMQRFMARRAVVDAETIEVGGGAGDRGGPLPARPSDEG